MLNDELAAAIGRVVVHAAWVDEALADLAYAFQRYSVADRTEVTGTSGSNLVKQLRIGGLDEYADEYAALNVRRNSVVHSRWFADFDRPGHMRSERTLRRTAGIEPPDAIEWGPGELEAFRSELDAFFQRVTKALFDKEGVSEWLRRRGEDRHRGGPWMTDAIARYPASG